MALSRVAVHFFCFLLLLVGFSTPGAQARESQFFSKATRYTAPDEATTPAKEEEPVPAAAKKVDEDQVQYKPDNGGGGYGLYGHAAPERSIPAATTSAGAAFPTSSYNSGGAGEKFSTESFPAELNNEGRHEVDGGVSYGNNKEFNAAGHPDGKQYYAGNTPTYNAGGTINPENYELNGGYKDYNKEASTRHVPSYANINRGEQYYGMSDTRFLDNGRYFYDLQAEINGYGRNGAGYDPAGGNPGGYGSTGGGQTFGNGGGSAYTFGNNNREESSGYEENNSMRGYRNNQREEFAP